MVTAPAAPRSGRARGLVLHLGLVTAAVVGTLGILSLGRGRPGPPPAPTPAAGASPHPGAHAGSVVWKLLAASAVIIVASRLVGALFRKMGQPHVIGEIVAGILLGPSLLGAVWPGATGWLFSADVLELIEPLAQLGLIFFMFLIGLEFEPRLLQGRGHAVAMVSHASIVVPFLLGVAIAPALYPRLGPPGGAFTPFALFLGASMSVTAFPVLARILVELELDRTRLGTTAVTCAAVDDVTAWCLLAVVAVVARAGSLARGLLPLCLSLGFVAVMLLGVRPVLARLARRYDARATMDPTTMAMLFVGILVSALITDRIGIHAIFGPFLFGAVMPSRSRLVGELTARLKDITVLFLLPLFFAFTGVRTRVGLIGADPKGWLMLGVILTVAVAGKWGGATTASRLLGFPWRESVALGALMNTRGLTELVILNVGLDLGVISPALFAMLVLMALVTTFAASPVIARIYPTPHPVVTVATSEEQRAEVKEAV